MILLVSQQFVVIKILVRASQLAATDHLLKNHMI
jgi:hypothetical protein